MNKKFLIMLIVFAISLPLFANKQEADDCLQAELKKLDKLGFTPVKKLQWLGTLNGGDQYKKGIVLEKNKKYKVVTGTDTNETGLKIEIISSRNIVVAKTTVKTSPLFLEYKPLKRGIHTFKITNTTNKNFWIYVGLTEKTKDATKPDPIIPDPPVVPNPPKPEPIFPPDVKPIKPNPLPTPIIDIQMPATTFPDKSPDGLPLPKTTKIKSVPNYLLSSMKGEAKKSSILHTFKNGEIGRLNYAVKGIVHGQLGYLSTVEFWLKDKGLALILGEKQSLTYAKVTKKGYENIILPKVTLNKLPQKYEPLKTNETLLHITYFNKTAWVFINRIPVLKFDGIIGNLAFFVRVTGASVVLSETKPKPEERIIIVDSKPNNEVHQTLGEFNKIPMKFTAKILKAYTKDKKLIEFWFNKQAISLLQLEDGTFNLYTFVKGKYIQLELPKSFVFDTTKAFTFEASRIGNFVILKLNGIRISQVKDISPKVQFKLRLFNYKLELMPK